MILPCELSGMKEPVGLQITTKVEGISVKYEIRGGNADTGIMESEGDLTLDFGDHLPIGRSASTTLIVHNQSAIRAPVDLAFLKFGLSQEALLAIDSQSQSMGTGDMSEYLKSSDMESLRTVRTRKRKVMMAKTLSGDKLETVLLSDTVVGKIESRLGQDKDKRQLEEAGNRGIVFLVGPVQGTLEPWGTTEFDITCVNNMCGTYFDTLHCEIGGLPSKPIPVKAGVIGSPLALQSQVYSVKKMIDSRSLNINWGELCVDSAVETRKFWVSNTSPFDMRVDWTVSLLGEPVSDADDQAIVALVPVEGDKVQVTLEERGKDP